jgi:hypothetical protein
LGIDGNIQGDKWHVPKKRGEEKKDGIHDVAITFIMDRRIFVPCGVSAFIIHIISQRKNSMGSDSSRTMEIARESIHCSCIRIVLK